MISGARWSREFLLDIVPHEAVEGNDLGPLAAGAFKDLAKDSHTFTRTVRVPDEVGIVGVGWREPKLNAIAHGEVVDSIVWRTVLYQ